MEYFVSHPKINYKWALLETSETVFQFKRKTFFQIPIIGKIIQLDVWIKKIKFTHTHFHTSLSIGESNWHSHTIWVIVSWSAVPRMPSFLIIRNPRTPSFLIIRNPRTPSFLIIRDPRKPSILLIRDPRKPSILLIRNPRKPSFLIIRNPSKPSFLIIRDPRKPSFLIIRNPRTPSLLIIRNPRKPSFLYNTWSQEAFIPFNTWSQDAFTPYNTLSQDDFIPYTCFTGLTLCQGNQTTFWMTTYLFQFVCRLSVQNDLILNLRVKKKNLDLSTGARVASERGMITEAKTFLCSLTEGLLPTLHLHGNFV